MENKGMLVAGSITAALSLYVIKRCMDFNAEYHVIKSEVDNVKNNQKPK